MSQQFVSEWNDLQKSIHSTAREKGWWRLREKLEDVCKSDAELHEFAKRTNLLSLHMLTVTEIAEAVEGIRHGNPPDDKVPEFTAAEAEAADAVIRLMDAAEANGWRLAEAIIAKAQMNKGRPVMHGGKKL